MKKIFAVLALCSILTACNNTAEEKTEVKAVDTLNTESPLMDAVNTADSVGKKLSDSTDKMINP